MQGSDTAARLCLVPGTSMRAVQQLLIVDIMHVADTGLPQVQVMRPCALCLDTSLLPAMGPAKGTRHMHSPASLHLWQVAVLDASACNPICDIAFYKGRQLAVLTADQKVSSPNASLLLLPTHDVTMLPCSPTTLQAASDLLQVGCPLPPGIARRR